MRRRQEERQHSKSTLARAARVLYAERGLVQQIEAIVWRRRLVAAAAVAFFLGLGLGAWGAPRLTAVQVGRIFTP